MSNDIEISIVCNAYNHGKYIRDALEGFVMQKTDFRFEVLIHDDASPDNTADIIREYEQKYPDIIKPIYQKENKYSKGIWVTGEYQYSRVSGKYIALCEGDDYWTDPYKLQKQYDALKAHPDIDICAHSSDLRYASDGSLKGTIHYSDEVIIIPVEDVINGGGDFVSTNSLLFKKEIVTEPKKFLDLLPMDYTIQISGSLSGGMLYLPDNMSAYRVSVPGSWSVTNDQNHRESLKFAKELKACLKQLDVDTGKKYHKTVSRKVLGLNKTILHQKMLILFKR